MEDNKQTPPRFGGAAVEGTRTRIGTQPGFQNLAPNPNSLTLGSDDQIQIQIQIMTNNNTNTNTNTSSSSSSSVSGRGSVDSGSDHSDSYSSQGLESSDDVSSDCESTVSDDSTRRDRPELESDSGLVRIDESSPVHRTLERKFISGLGPLAAHTTVVAIHRKPYSTHIRLAKLQAFRVFTRALELKCGGHPNLKCAWSATSREEMASTLTHGFARCPNPQNDGLYGSAVCLSPVDSPIHSVKFASVDQDGLRHVLLCRVLLGNAEIVRPGSQQCHPSSDLFDSGVDSLVHPTKYIVWSTHMNTHILPECVISFRAPVNLEGFVRTQEPVRRPTSPWIPFPALISELSKQLSPMCARLISKKHKLFVEKKISRQELVQLVRQIAGDELLIAIIQSFKARLLGARTGRTRDGAQFPGLSNQSARGTGGARKHSSGLGKSSQLR